MSDGLVKVNPHFPFWPAANYILKKIAENDLSVYVTRGDDWFSDVDIAYITPEIQMLIPFRYQKAFRLQYFVFLAWADITLDVDNHIDSFGVKEFSDFQLKTLQMGLRCRRNKYDRHAFAKFEDVFLDIMGVE